MVSVLWEKEYFSTGSLRTEMKGVEVGKKGDILSFDEKKGLHRHQQQQKE